MQKERYNKKIARDICVQLAAGRSLRSICDHDDAMPHESTVRAWVVDDKDGFAKMYARARDIGLDVLADECIEIADSIEVGELVKTITDKDGTRTEVTKSEMYQHRRLRFDARRWYLSKLAPKKYGDKEKTDADDDGAGVLEIKGGLPD